jgi:hypothetical protein
MLKQIFYSKHMEVLCHNCFHCATIEFIFLIIFGAQTSYPPCYHGQHFISILFKPLEILTSQRDSKKNASISHCEYSPVSGRFSKYIIIMIITSLTHAVLHLFLNFPRFEFYITLIYSNNGNFLARGLKGLKQTRFFMFSCFVYTSIITFKTQHENCVIILENFSTFHSL